jgi:hypothetical protein
MLLCIIIPQGGDILGGDWRVSFRDWKLKIRDWRVSFGRKYSGLKELA